MTVLAQGADQSQTDKGRLAVGQACAPCHNNILRITQIHKKSADQWRDTVYSMIGRGAQILPEEIEPIVTFLAANSARQSAPPSASGAQAASGQLAEGQGKTILQRQCSQCHDAQAALRKPAGDDWKTVIVRMVSYGATVSAADQQVLVEYLSALTK
jgi:cytochrome c5